MRQTPLMVACFIGKRYCRLVIHNILYIILNVIGNLQIIKYLLDQNIEVNKKDNASYTALHW